MSVGTSGRIVIEIDPELKRQLYAELQKDGLTLKEWFTRQLETYVYDNVQLSLNFNDQITSRGQVA